jgi:uncharacterized membrane protein YphA (DoxX/SURF4 family)
MDTTGAVRSKGANRALWILQVLLAALFLFAGVTKFSMSPEQMNEGSPVPLPGWFLRFIGVCEVLGAIGLVLPGALGIRPGLTPLAAAALVILMVGAVVIPLVGGTFLPALFPLIVGMLLAVVAYARRSPAPQPDRV